MLGRGLSASADRPADEEDWRRDPLTHPALAAMSPRELADLPFDRCQRLGRDTR